jgi:cytochrome c-type biogenesis protein
VDGAPLALAFTAGLVATFNPCGFAMLPAYIAWFVGTDGDDRGDGSVDAALGRALLVGGVVASGFLTVFGIAALLLHVGLRIVIDVIPWVALGVGVAMIVLGAAVIGGYKIPLALGRTAPSQRDLRSMFAFGISYALASLSCTLPVFLTVVVGSLATTSAIGGITTLAAYGLAMSLSLLGVTVAVSLARHGTVQRFRRMTRHVDVVAGGLLIAAGLYITWYWAITLRSGAGATGATGGFVEALSQRALQVTSDHWTVITGALIAVIAAAALRVLLRPTVRRPTVRHRAGGGRTPTGAGPDGGPPPRRPPGPR